MFCKKITKEIKINNEIIFSKSSKKIKNYSSPWDDRVSLKQQYYLSNKTIQVTLKHTLS